MDYIMITDNLKQFMGTGLLFVVFLCAVLYLFFTTKSEASRAMFVWFPMYVMLIFFCPIWILYMKLRDDGEILYRILWLVPMAAVVCFALVKFVYEFNGKRRLLAFTMSVAIIILSGQYVYSNRQFHKAENIYHIPQTVVDICDEIMVPGREVRACFPIEMVQYVRQYTPYVCQPYGRDTLLWGEAYDAYSTIATFLSSDVLDSKGLTDELRHSDTPYLIVSEDTKFTEDLSDYRFYYVFSIDGYDVYLDNDAYLGLYYMDYK